MNTRYLPAIFFGILCFKLISSNADLKYEKCYATKDKKICYLRGAKHIRSWKDSRNICDSKNLALPSFINTDEKETLANYFGYLKYFESDEVEISRVWSAGRRIVYDNWTWTNDQIWNSSRRLNSENNGSHVVAAANGSMLTQDPSSPSLYLCQYSGDFCRTYGSLSRVVHLRGTCIIWCIQKKTWYKARNDCLNSGGDLAFIDSEDAQTLVRSAQKVMYDESSTYWIGLRKVSWAWITHSQRIKGQPEQVTFTDWSELEQFHSSRDVCIYVDASDGKWRTSDCSNAMSVICQRKEVIESSKVDSSTNMKKILKSGSSQSVTSVLCPKLNSSDEDFKYERCYPIKDKKICYFRESESSHSWNDSRNICDSKNLTLPSFINTDEKETLANYFSYLKYFESEEVENFRIWSSGRRIVYDNWTWINDQMRNGNRRLNSENNGSHVAAANGSLLTQDPSRPSWYLCQYSGDRCRKSNSHSPVVHLRETCLIPYFEKKTWYKARNDCLNRGGDLPFIDSEDAKTIERYEKTVLTVQHSAYWIGLRKVSWVWITHFQRIKGQPEQVKFTDWSDQTQFHSSGDVCIYVDASDGKWRTSDCSNAMSVICQRKEVIESSKVDSSTKVMETLQPGSSEYVTIGSVIAVAGFMCVTSISIAVFIAKRKAYAVRRRDTLVDGQYQVLKRKQSNAVSEVIDYYESIEPEDEQNAASEVADNYATIGLEDEFYENTAYLFCNSGYGSDAQHLNDKGEDKEMKILPEGQNMLVTEV